MKKAPAYSTTLTDSQVAIIRKEFPEETWRWSEVFRTVLKDYFEARGIPWPEDNNVFGGWRNHPNRKSSV